MAKINCDLSLVERLKNLGFTKQTEVDMVTKLVHILTEKTDGNPGAALKILNDYSQKVQDDVTTANIVVSNTISVLRSMPEVDFNHINANEVMLAIFATARGAAVERYFSQLMGGFDGKIPERIVQLAKYMQELNPHAIKQAYEHIYHQKGSYMERALHHRSALGPVFDTNELPEPITYVSPDGQQQSLATLDELLVHTRYTAFGEGGIGEALAPQETPQGLKFKEHTFEEIKTVVEKMVDQHNRFDNDTKVGLPPMIRELAVDLAAGFYYDLNNTNVLLQELGVHMQWNPHYVMTNQHYSDTIASNFSESLTTPSLKENKKLKKQKQKINKFMESHLPTDLQKDPYYLDRVAAAIPSFDGKMEKLTPTQRFSLAYTNFLMPLIHIERTLGEQKYAKYSKLLREGDTKGANELLYKRVYNIAETKIKSVLTTTTTNQIDQVDEMIAHASATQKLYTNRSLYFKDATAHVAFLKEMNPLFAKTENKGSSIHRETLTQMTRATEDLTSIRLLGTNPLLTYNKLRDTLPSGKSGDGTMMQNNVITSLTSIDRSISDSVAVKELLFGKGRDRIPFVDQKHTEVMRNIAASNTKEAQQLLGYFGYEEGATWRDISNSPTAYAQSAVNLVVGTVPTLMQPIVLVSNFILEPMERAMRFTIMRSDALGAAEATGGALTQYSVLIKAALLNWKSDAHVAVVKQALASASGINKKDLTPELMHHMLGHLGLLNEYMHLLSRVADHNANNGLEHPSLHNMKGFLNTPLAHKVGLSNMSQMSLALNITSAIQTHGTFKSCFTVDENGAVHSVRHSKIFMDYLDRFKINEALLGAVNEYSPDLFGKSAGIIDVDALVRPPSDTLEADKFLDTWFKRDPGAKEAYTTGLNSLEKSVKSSISATLKNSKKELLAELVALKESPVKKADSVSTDGDLLMQEEAIKDRIKRVDEELRSIDGGQVPDSFLESYEDTLSSYKMRAVRDANTRVAKLLDRLLKEANRTVDSSTDWNAYVMSNSPKARAITALFFNMKRFMIAFTSDTIDKGGMLKDKHKMGTLINYAVASTAMYGVSGMVYETVRGLLEGKKKGLLEIIADTTDTQLSAGQKLLRVFGTLTKATLMGIPVGTFVRAALPTQQHAQASDVLTAIFGTPLTSSAMKLYNTQGTTMDAIDAMTQGDPEAFKKQLKALDRLYRATPIQSFLLARALYNYAAVPYLEELEVLNNHSEDVYKSLNELEEHWTARNAVDSLFEDRGRLQFSE